MARNFRGSGRKTDYNWRNFASTNTLLAFGAGTVAFTAFNAEVGQLSRTLMRTRGEWVCYPDAAQSPASLIMLTIGLIVVPAGSGTTVTVKPFTDSQASWFWWDMAWIGYEEPVTDVIQIPMLAGVRRVIDSKAMRKLPPETEIQCVLENTTIGSAQTVNVGVAGRCLFGR